jgi:peptide-methionine (R)-S-oxide reductase
MRDKITKSKQQWRLELTPEQYRVCRLKDTERPFSGQYWNHQEAGRYRCVCCGAPLFGSETKFNAGCGWPSFSAPIAAQNVATETDNSHHMQRTEVLCGKCGAHLGHVFEDGPQPTGLRYCINSVALQFQADAASPFQQVLESKRGRDSDKTN